MKNSLLKYLYLHPAGRNLFWLLSANALTGVLGIVTMVKLANVLGVTRYGTYAFAVALSMYGSTLIRYGRERNMVRNLIQNTDQQNQTIASTLILSVVILCISMLILGVYSSIDESGLGLGGFMIILGLCLISIDFQPVYDSWDLMGRHAIYLTISRFCQYGLLWIFFLFAPQQLNLVYVGSIMVASALLFLGIQYTEVFRKTRLILFTRENYRQALLLTVSNSKIAMAVFLSLVFGPTLRIFIKVCYDEATLGIFSAAWQYTAIGILIFLQIGRIGNPSMARVTMQGVQVSRKQKALLKYLLILSAAAVPLAMPALLFPRFIIGSLFDPEYAQAADVLPVLGIYLLIYPLAIVAAQYVISCRYEGLYLRNVLIGGCVGLVLGIPMIINYSIVGAAWALLLSHSVVISLNLLTTLCTFRPAFPE